MPYRQLKQKFNVINVISLVVLVVDVLALKQYSLLRPILYWSFCSFQGSTGAFGPNFKMDVDDVPMFWQTFCTALSYLGECTSMSCKEE